MTDTPYERIKDLVRERAIEAGDDGIVQTKLTKELRSEEWVKNHYKSSSVTGALSSAISDLEDDDEIKVRRNVPSPGRGRNTRRIYPDDADIED